MTLGVKGDTDNTTYTSLKKQKNAPFCCAVQKVKDS